MAARALKAAEELGFQPNRTARNLRLRRSTLVALVIPDIENQFFTSLARGVEDVAQQAGYNVMLCNTDEDSAKEAGYLQAIEAERMAGAIVSPAGDGRSLRPLIKAGVPVVAVDRSPGKLDVDTVLIDNEASAEAATARLIHAGRRVVGCLAGPASVPTIEQRVNGYRRAVASLDSGELVERTDLRPDDAYRATLRLLRRSPRPDALFAVNNTAALGALRALREAGLGPDDFGLAWFGVEPWTEAVGWPSIMVDQPTRKLGETAATMLLERMNGSSEPARRVVLPTSVRDPF